MNRIKEKEGGVLETILAGSGIFIATYDLAAISVALLVLGKAWKLNGFDLSLLGSAALFGAIAGSATAGIFADRFGRRAMLVGDFIAYVAASIGSAFSPDFTWLFFFRFIVGAGIGADFAVVFPYISEIRSAGTRGRNMATVMMAANFGMIIAYGLGGLFLGTGGQGWRIVLLAGGLMAVPVIFMRSRISESSAWKRSRLPRVRDILAGFNRKDLRNIAVASAAWFSYQVSDQGLSVFLPLLLLTTLGTDKTIVISPTEQFGTGIRATGHGIAESIGRAGGLAGVLGYGILSALYGPWAGIMYFSIFATVGLLVSFAMRETGPMATGSRKITDDTSWYGK